MDSMTSLHASGALLVVFKSNQSANLGQLDVTDCTFESNRVALPESITPHYYSGARYLRGGGMHLMFTGIAMGNRVNIVDSNFQSNAAPNGGGLALYFDDQSSRNNVSISISDKSPDRIHSFWNNKALTPCYEGNVKVPGTGGAVNVEFFGRSKQNSVELDGLDLTGNVANKGGALYVWFPWQRTKEFHIGRGECVQVEQRNDGSCGCFLGWWACDKPDANGVSGPRHHRSQLQFRSEHCSTPWSVPPHVCWGDSVRTDAFPRERQLSRRPARLHPAGGRSFELHRERCASWRRNVHVWFEDRSTQWHENVVRRERCHLAGWCYIQSHGFWVRIHQLLYLNVKHCNTCGLCSRNLSVQE